MDWPLSYQQRGNVRTDYYLDGYRGDLTDEQRLQQIVDVYRDDPATEPLRLLMGYMSSVDSVGHRYGPLAPQTMAAVHSADSQVGHFLEQMLELFREKMEPQDSFYLLISTDHGMAEVTHYVSLEQLVGQPLASSAFLSTGGNIGHIHLRRVPRGPQRQQAAEELAERLAARPYLRAFTRDQIPERWEYQHPGRVGDVVVVLEPGHTFQRGLETERVPIAQASGPRGMHGYPVEDSPEMLGLLVLWRYPKPLPSIDWGPVDSLRLHATVADILGIEPAELARQPGLSLRSTASPSTVESAP
jgi:predicted AlkP superfamily pyrophosphatase or phosphodiesterase